MERLIALTSVTLIYLVASVGCKAEQSATQNHSFRQISTNIVEDKTRKKNSIKTIAYAANTASASQELQVDFHKKNKIVFILKLDAACKRELRGEASSSGADFEIDEDEDGVAYPSEEFIYRSSNDYFLSIRISADENDKARVKEEGAESCPFINDIMRTEKQ